MYAEIKLIHISKRVPGYVITVVRNPNTSGVHGIWQVVISWYMLLL